jgi:hypothetical protein
MTGKVIQVGMALLDVAPPLRAANCLMFLRSKSITDLQGTMALTEVAADPFIRHFLFSLA